MSTTTPQPSNGQFVFICCQVGAEKALKQDLAERHPNLAFAFSRPGFVTFKRLDDTAVDRIESPFARTFGFSIAQIKTASNPESAIAECFAPLSRQGVFQQLHVWERDRTVPGDRGFEPLGTESSRLLGERLKTLAGTALADAAVNRRAMMGDRIANVVALDDGHWFVGYHHAVSTATSWPGGVPLLKLPDPMISRAYLKMQEALRWSRLPIRPGDVCAELGSSPGGSCQALLEHGAHVLGIDPAVMDPRILEHPHFTHLRARAADLKRREFSQVQWLMTDANIAPTNALDAVEPIVTHRRVQVSGMLLTLKLLDWSMAGEIDTYLARIRSWGYRHIRARQLALNRREICVLAAKSKSRLRLRGR